jgi:hypothetical protein
MAQPESLDGNRQIGAPGTGMYVQATETMEGAGAMARSIGD